MLKNILHIDNKIAAFYQQMDEMKKIYDKQFRKISGEKETPNDAEKLQKIKNEMINSIGIQEWFDYLYYEI